MFPNNLCHMFFLKFLLPAIFAVSDPKIISIEGVSNVLYFADILVVYWCLILLQKIILLHVKIRKNPNIAHR